MRFKNRASIFLVLIVCFLGSLQSNNQIVIVNDNLHTNKRSIEEDAFSAVAYLSLFRDAHEKYLQKNKIDPKIKCKQCTTKELSLGEFEGYLVGMALKDIVDGKDNFAQTKLLLDGCLKVVSEGSHSDVINYMIRISNEIKQVCSHCHYDGHGDSWEKID